MKNLQIIKGARQRLLTKAAVTVVTNLSLKQTDDLKSLFEGATVEFKSPDGAIKGTIVENNVQILVTQDQVIDGIKVINPTTEALPLAEQVESLKAIIGGYDNFVAAVEEAVTELNNTIKQATAKKIKTVSQALDIVKQSGVFVSKAETEVPAEQQKPVEQKTEASVKRFKGRRLI